MSTRIVDHLVVPKEDGMRLDVVLASDEALPARSACARLIEAGCVSVNATCATSKSERVVLGDRIQVVLDEADSTPIDAGVSPILPTPIPLDIRYEDDEIIVLSKQPGLVCHPSPGHESDTLANALVAHCGYEHLGHLQGEDRPGIVHRLDQDTSGLMLAAKTDEAQRSVQDLIRLRVLDRRYITLVHGYVAPDSGMVESGIARSSRDRLRMAVTDDPAAREAITTFDTLERFEAGPRDEGYTLLECHLFTGRTHQIRVHMRHIGHPVVGDQLYGRGDLRQNLGLSRQFLHSWSVCFEHPSTGQELRLHDTLPADLAAALSSIEQRSMGKTQAGERIVSALMQGFSDDATMQSTDGDEYDANRSF